MLDLLVFLFISFIIVASSMLVLASKEVVHSALYLALAFLGIAALFVTLNAEFLAAVQVLIYVGAIIILMLFAIMLTKKEGGGK